MISSKTLPPPADRYTVRRALLSVSDKAGLAEFAMRLHGLGIELLSTGGTAQTIREAGIPVKDVAEVTGSPELLGGRVKTLHPNIHAGILARRTDEDDLSQLEEHGIGLIDLVVVNLYPFADAVANANLTDALAAENIDIGGPTMVRASAKNWFFVGVVTDPTQYEAIAEELETNDGSLGMITRHQLARAAFGHTAEYDAAITAYLTGEFVEIGRGPVLQGGVASTDFAIQLPRAQSLRYGENPHQQAALYGDPSAFYEKLHGKALSFNNLIDLSAALRLIAEFEEAPPTVAILKHTNPCGVGTAASLEAAYQKALATDRQSPFGGIVVVNQPLDLSTAKAIDAVFTEIIIAPGYGDGVLDFLMEKQNRRLIKSLASARNDAAPDVRSVVGGMLVQDADAMLASPISLRVGWAVATDRQPSESEWADLDFAWRVCKHVKSNAIVYAKDDATLGIGAGQMSRIDSSEIALAKGAKSGLGFSGCVVASDAFFPFADGLLAAADAGATAAIQPGGSVRDDEVIAAANERGMTMVFTGERHFRH